jgi:hypothetical protein
MVALIEKLQTNNHQRLEISNYEAKKSTLRVKTFTFSDGTRTSEPQDEDSLSILEENP